MAKGINKVILVGHLGADPEMRYTSGGAAIANISVATSEQWKDKQTGERQERTEWHKVTLFGRQGEVAGQYLKKGALVYIEGRLQTDKWQDQSGNDRYTTKVIANNMQMLGGGQSANNEGGRAEPQQPAQPQTPPADDFDDDIPF